MPDITLSFTVEQVDRFDPFARDRYPWEGAGSDTRNARELFRIFVSTELRRGIKNFERNLRAEVGKIEFEDVV